MSSLDIFIVISAFLGSFSTYWGVHRLKWSAVLASSLFSLIFALIMNWIPWFDADLTFKLSVVFIGASFVGMSSEKLVENEKYLFIATLFYLIMFLRVSSVFNGFGGGLGTSATIGVVSVLGIKKLLDRIL